MIRDTVDADLFSSDYAAGSDENRCNLLQDGLKKQQERGMSRHRRRITLLMVRRRLIWFTTESLLVQRGFGERESPG